MDEKVAVDILKAVACCSVSNLSCDDCPGYGKKSICRSWDWDDELIAKAVITLNKKGGVE